MNPILRPGPSWLVLFLLVAACETVRRRLRGAGARCDHLVGLEVTPAPDSVLRIWFYVVGAHGPFRLAAPPTPAPFAREGFVVTEWGIMVSDLSFGL